MVALGIEQNLFLLPAAAGTFHWQEHTLVFTPRQPLIPSTTYIVSLDESVKSQDGVPLAITYFSTATMGVRVGSDQMMYVVNPLNGQERPLGAGEDPSWANDNRSLFFARDGQLWQVSGDGKDAQKLTQEDAIRISLPQESPRSPVVVFSGSNAAGIDNIYSLELASRAVRQLTSFYEPARITQVRWSPDGLYVAFLRDTQIWIMNQDGTNLKRLTTDELRCTVNFAWSPGGTKIAFTGGENIWVGDIYSLEMRKLSFDDPNTGWVDWSHANRIAYESAGIVVMNADGSNEQRLATGGKRPLWVGDTDQLSFVLSLQQDEFAAQLWTIDLATQNKNTIANIDLRSPHVSWSRNVRDPLSP